MYARLRWPSDSLMQGTFGSGIRSCIVLKQPACTLYRPILRYRSPLQMLRSRFVDIGYGQRPQSRYVIGRRCRSAPRCKQANVSCFPASCAPLTGGGERGHIAARSTRFFRNFGKEDLKGEGDKALYIPPRCSIHQHHYLDGRFHTTMASQDNTTTPADVAARDVSDERESSPLVRDL